MLATVSICSLYFFSLPVIANFMMFKLERPYYNIKIRELPPVGVISVLAGGYRHGYGLEEDHLDYTTYTRTMRGIEAFKVLHPRLLVMSGKMPSGDEDGKMGKLMKNLAVENGVPKEQVYVEAGSKNTSEHPLKLRDVVGVKEAETVGIVTSAWHMPRAEKEFKKYFKNVIPIPCDFISHYVGFDLSQFFPQAESLNQFTRMSLEKIGKYRSAMKEIQ